MLSNQIAISNIKMKTYQQFWQSLTPLYDAGEAQAIVRTVLDVEYGMTLTDIICGKVNELSSDEERNLEEIITRLQNGEPVQYVLGEADFAGRTFHMEPGVLIPRPETAELCQWIEEEVSSLDADDPKQILDICTGSGCIAITLGLTIPNSEVTGWDISEDALRIAQGNVEMLKTGNVRIEYQDALMLPKAEEAEEAAEISEATKSESSLSKGWNVIVSNPPYICQSEAMEMERRVLDFEPHCALFVPDDDPLRFYRVLCRLAQRLLLPGGWLLVEINRAYAEHTAALMRESGLHEVEVREDAYGNPRMVGGRM